MKNVLSHSRMNQMAIALIMTLIVGPAVAVDIIQTNEKTVPKWFLELPQEAGIIYAIGESGYTVTNNEDSLDAVTVAANRIAGCKKMEVRYKIAHLVVNNKSYVASYEKVIPDPGEYNKVIGELTVLDDFVMDGIYYVLVSHGSNSGLHKKYLKRIPYKLQEPGVPDWVNRLTNRSGHYGLGMSKRSQADGWVDAEDNAWADIASQLSRNIDVTEDDFFDTRIQWVHEGKATVEGTRILARWESKSKTKYVLIKAPEQK